MKNIALIAGFVGLIAILVFTFRPDNQSQTIDNAVVPSETAQQVVPQPSTQLNQEVTSAANPQLTAASEENNLHDTKSDLSIEPIDPATDPGNQIIEQN